MMAELPLALFTTLAPIGAGAFVALAVAFFTTKFSDEQLRKIDRMTAIPVVALVAGFICAFFHLASPMHAFGVFAGVGASPLSNELLAGVVFAVLAIVYWIVALAGKLDKKDYRVYAILGDGELEEGQVWEAAMFAPHYKLDNVTIFVDFNGLQIDGDISKVMSPLPIDEKFKAFGWNVVVIDAHNYDEIKEAIKTAKSTKGKPTAVIAKSVKGKGVSFMENEASWHGAAPNKEQYEQAISELDAHLKELEVR